MKFSLQNCLRNWGAPLIYFLQRRHLLWYVLSLCSGNVKQHFRLEITLGKLFRRAREGKNTAAPLSSGNFDNSLYLDAKKPCPNGENPRKRPTPGKNLPFPVRQANTSHKYLEFYDSTIKIYKIRCAQCLNRPPFLVKVTLPVDWP